MTTKKHDKKVQVISVHNEDGKFMQFLKKSEVRFLIPMMKDNALIEIKLVELPFERYKIEFGI